MQYDGTAYVLSENEREAPLSSGSSPAIGETSIGETSIGDTLPSAPENAGLLFGKYVRYVARIGGTILGRSDEVDDVIQDVFLAVHHDLHNLRDAACTKAWIATITVRIARQRRAERSMRRRIGEIRPGELEAFAAPMASAEDKADLSEKLRVMLALPPALRAAWLLKYVDNEPLARIAALCSCSESTVQRRIRVAESSIRGASPRRQAVIYPEQAVLLRSVESNAVEAGAGAQVSRARAAERRHVVSTCAIHGSWGCTCASALAGYGHSK